MKRFAALCLPMLIAACVAFGQNAPTKVARIEFMKIKPGKFADYTKLEKTWKEVHQDRVTKGQVDSWTLFGVIFPGGAEREYDAVTMHIYPSMAKMESSYDESQMAKIRSFPPAEEMRTLVRSEFWVIGATAGDPLEGRFMYVRFQKAKPGSGGYSRAVREHWLPINQDLVKRGIRNGWFWMPVVFRGHSRVEYNWVTLDALPKFDSLTNSMTGVDSKKIEEAARVSDQARETVYDEYWRRVDTARK